MYKAILAWPILSPAGGKENKVGTDDVSLVIQTLLMLLNKILNLIQLCAPNQIPDRDGAGRPNRTELPEKQEKGPLIMRSAAPKRAQPSDKICTLLENEKESNDTAQEMVVVL